jgi:hypothetical protein
MEVKWNEEEFFTVRVGSMQPCDAGRTKDGRLLMFIHSLCSDFSEVLDMTNEKVVQVSSSTLVRPIRIVVHASLSLPE